MKDLRQPNIHIGNTVKISKLEINEDNVKEILMTLGVMPTETLIREAIGYLSSNGLEFTMLNLYNFLKSKSIMSMKDLRKTTAKNKIITENIPINNIETFNNNMYQKGYSDLTNNFLIKEFDNIEINITRSNDNVSAITGYDNEHNIVDIPNDILNIVQNDIFESNK